VVNTLIDAGPLIALFDKDDQFHVKVKEFLKTFHGHLITTWPVLTEVTHLLDFNVNVQVDFLKWVQREAVKIVNLDNIHLVRIIELTEKYSDVPMDLADASLMVLAEKEKIKNIITIDSDYHIYRTNKKLKLTNLLDGY
jgi:predicted nucleic acid-binding protein